MLAGAHISNWRADGTPNDAPLRRCKVLFRPESGDQITLLPVPWSSNCGSLSVLTELPWPLNVT